MVKAKPDYSQLQNPLRKEGEEKCTFHSRSHWTFKMSKNFMFWAGRIESWENGQNVKSSICRRKAMATSGLRMRRKIPVSSLNDFGVALFFRWRSSCLATFPSFLRCLQKNSEIHSFFVCVWLTIILAHQFSVPSTQGQHWQPPGNYFYHQPWTASSCRNTALCRGPSNYSVHRSGLHICQAYAAHSAWTSKLFTQNNTLHLRPMRSGL